MGNLEGESMVTAIVLLKVERTKIHGVAEKLADMKPITEVYSIAGAYDLAVMLRAKDNEKVAQTVTEELLQVEGILDSETLIAFRVYSRYDLERMFDFG